MQWSKNLFHKLLKSSFSSKSFSNSRRQSPAIPKENWESTQEAVIKRGKISVGASVLILLIGFFLPAPVHALALTEDEEQELIQTLASPEVLAIRRYIDACLSNQLVDPEDAYPCQMSDVEQGLTIKEHPAEDISGAFTVIWVQPFDYGGQVFTLLFADPPNLAVDIWVYREGGTRPDVRSFMARKWSDEDRLSIVKDLGDYLTDKRFTR